MTIFRDTTQILVPDRRAVSLSFASSGCRTTHSWRHVHRQFSHRWRGFEANARQRRWSFHHSDAVLHRLLHLLESTHAYLAHALARDAELVRELLERDRFFGEPCGGCRTPRLRRVSSPGRHARQPSSSATRRDYRPGYRRSWGRDGEARVLPLVQFG